MEPRKVFPVGSTTTLPPSEGQLMVIVVVGLVYTVTTNCCCGVHEYVKHDEWFVSGSPLRTACR